MDASEVTRHSFDRSTGMGGGADVLCKQEQPFRVALKRSEPKAATEFGRPLAYCVGGDDPNAERERGGLGDREGVP
jgi:hypothetical protein